jgi:polyferredoxin
LLTFTSAGAEESFPLPYRLPPAYMLLPDKPAVPVWVEAWRDAQINIAMLTATLIVLTLIFVFQDRLAQSRLAHRLIRTGFLLFVLIWLGWAAGGQLSIINVMHWVTAPLRGFDTAFLLEPLIVIIAAYTAISMVLIGRGVFCGWLCPFGALQELLGQAARALRLPQWTPSVQLESQLRSGKYIVAALLLITAVASIGTAESAAEIEPFKTAITAKFTRAWPYVAYALALLAIGLFTERAYCRFLCPLGGVLAALDRFHLLDRLRRRAECGNPCRLCEAACPVRAIEKSGKIVTAECFQCLDCQVEYFDDQRCPPLVAARRLANGANGKAAARA